VSVHSSDKFLSGNHFTYGFNGMAINLEQALCRQIDYFLGVKSRTALNQSKGEKNIPKFTLRHYL